MGVLKLCRIEKLVRCLVESDFSLALLFSLIRAAEVDSRAFFFRFHELDVVVNDLKATQLINCELQAARDESLIVFLA